MSVREGVRKFVLLCVRGCEKMCERGIIGC